jgi:hypothetical protein
VPEFNKNIHYRSHFDILEKVFKCQIIRRQDFAAFESFLKEHQKAVCTLTHRTADFGFYCKLFVIIVVYVLYFILIVQLVAGGYTVPEKTLLEHNMMAVSNVYDNIRIADLAAILQVDISRAEKVSEYLILDYLKPLLNQLFIL